MASQADGHARGPHRNLRSISVFKPCEDSAERCSILTANVSLTEGDGPVFDPTDSHLIALDLYAPKTQKRTEEGRYDTVDAI